MLKEEQSIIRKGDLMRSRNEVVRLVNSWIGKNEADGSFKSIIDIYNSYNGKLPRGIKMNYNWAWCACTWSALAIKLGYTDIMPIEISCGFLIDEANKMGCWVEDDGYIPKPGDAVLYDWQDNGKSDNTAWPDHVGTVTYVNKDAGYFEVTEGNYSDSVKKRTVSINGKFIRGFIAPKYDEEIIEPVQWISGKSISEVAHEVITGKWGNNPERATRLQLVGYDPKAVQDEVNKILNGSAIVPSNPVQDHNQPYDKQVNCTCYAKYKNTNYDDVYETTANLYLRNDAGTNKKALCLIPKGTDVHCYGYYSISNKFVWLLVEVVLDGVKYTGFCHKAYLKEK